MQAIRHLEEAGPGAGLERFRFELWGRLLRTSHASPALWQRYIAAGLPDDLDRRAKTALGAALLEDGRTREAIAVLNDASAEGDLDADAALLKIPGPARQRAARRMAVRDPARLHRLDGRLERTLLGHLTPPEWISRARAWCRLGRPRAGARELSRRRWRGGIERLRRDQLAHCWLAAGEPRPALRVLPHRMRSTAGELLLRARCELKRAWNLFPRRSSHASFAAAADDALRVAAFPAAQRTQRNTAWEIVLEAMTEQGRLKAAWNAWVQLRRAGWTSPRRSWLGRRLGVAMTRRPGWTRQVRELERELPGQRRCLEFWAAVHRRNGSDELRELARAPVPDLYAEWSRRRLGLPAVSGPIGTTPVGAATPPVTVGDLLQWGETAAARLEWRRLRRIQVPSPQEALAAAKLEARGPDPTQAIRWLRTADPRLGTIQMDRCPRDLIRAYLPLRWAGAITAAARETGLDPWLIAALARQESTFAPHARSPRGAVGLLQLTAGTARRHARQLGLGRHPNLKDPVINLRLGARELAMLIARFGALEPALAAYNGGAPRTARWWKRWPDPERFTEAIPVPETYTYVRRVIYLSGVYRRVYAAQWRQHD